MGIIEVESGRAADYELARRAAAGDAGALEALYRRYFRRVYSVCLRMTRNTHDAEDLAQEVFVHIFKKISSFRGDSKFTTWLHQVTVNHVLMSLRKRKRRPEEGPEEAAEVRAARGVKMSPRMPVIDRIALKRAVALLPRGCRTVFGLYDVEGYDHAEIARMLGVSEGTSKSQLHRARHNLRKLLQQQARPPREAARRGESLVLSLEHPRTALGLQAARP
jgi:RNA polymerase sigma-70 factor, ECF subfamily